MLTHIIEAQQFDRERIRQLFFAARNLEQHNTVPLPGKILASLFYEPSTRTRFSFESAMLRLGGNVITTENAREFSSVAKGETLEDSIRVVGNYADVIVLRHHEEGASRRAAAVSSVPIINAGDGPGQHPTQALLDLYTIERELGRLDGLTIVLMGDLKHGRTIRSLAYLIGKYNDCTIHFISPPELCVSDDIKEYLGRHQVVVCEQEQLSDALLGSVDVLYQTRIQKERFTSVEEYEKFQGRYILTKAHADAMKEQSIIMHPLPRVGEILYEVDTSLRAAYFKQARYGVFVRMALLQSLFA